MRLTRQSQVTLFQLASLIFLISTLIRRLKLIFHFNRIVDPFNYAIMLELKTGFKWLIMVQTSMRCNQRSFACFIHTLIQYVYKDNMNSAKIIEDPFNLNVLSALRDLAARFKYP